MIISIHREDGRLHSRLRFPLLRAGEEFTERRLKPVIEVFMMENESRQTVESELHRSKQPQSLADVPEDARAYLIRRNNESAWLLVDRIDAVLADSRLDVRAFRCGGETRSPSGVMGSGAGGTIATSPAKKFSD